MTIQSNQPDQAATDTATATFDKARRLQAMLDYLLLPAPVVIGRPEKVHVMAASIDDLLPWQQQLSGSVHVTSAGDGVELWTLRTKTPQLGDGDTLPVWISAPVPAGEMVADELRAAVVPEVPVDGPWRIGVTTLPAGAGLDVSHYLAGVVTRLAQAAEEDPKGLLAELLEIAALARSAGPAGSDSHAAHERDSLVDELLAEVAGDGVLPVYGAQVVRLVETLQSVGQAVAAA